MDLNGEIIAIDCSQKVGNTIATRELNKTRIDRIIGAPLRQFAREFLSIGLNYYRHCSNSVLHLLRRAWNADHAPERDTLAVKAGKRKRPGRQILYVVDLHTYWVQRSNQMVWKERRVDFDRNLNSVLFITVVLPRLVARDSP